MSHCERSEIKHSDSIFRLESTKIETLSDLQDRMRLHSFPRLSEKKANKPKPGFTLLEVLLALALGAIVLVAIATAVSMHLRLLDRGRNSVEEAQLARAVLNMIADDLRATIRYTPPNTEAIKALEASIQPSKTGSSGDDSGTGGSPGGQGQGASSGNSQSGSGGSSGNPSPGTSGQSGSSGSSGGSGSSSGGGSSSGASSAGGSSGGASGTTDTNQEPEGATGEESTQSIPGLYGTLYELQIDIARAPSSQQPLPGVPADGSVLPMATSGVQRIRYYIDALGTAAAGTPSMTAGTGLIRRQVDRAIASWAAADGQSEAPGELIQELAPEVTEIEFYYYDGYEWLEEWNSTPEQPLPLAVEITVGILPRQLRRSLEMNAAAPADAIDTGILYYKLIVHLPSAEVGASTSSGTMEEDDDGQQNGSGTGGGSNQNPSGGSQGGVRA